MTGTEIVKLVVCIAACEGVGLIGALFTRQSIPTWYARLKRPAFTPPNWLFGPAWGTLYLLMGISAFLVWQRPGVAGLLFVFLVQLLLNLLWTIVFFGARSPGGGVVMIAVLWVAILWTMVSFYGVSALAAWLLLPYILWVTFAAALNVSVWRLNRGKAGPG